MDNTNELCLPTQQFFRPKFLGGQNSGDFRPGRGLFAIEVPTDGYDRIIEQEGESIANCLR